MGDRTKALARAVDVIRGQRAVQVDVVVVGNGCDVTGLPHDVRVVVLPENVGIPAGRNTGWEATSGEFVAFLDDDGWLESDDALAIVAEQFAGDIRLGIVSLRIADPDGGGTSRRHVPRLRASDPMRPGEVTTFLGGACVVRRALLDACGGLPGDFFYAHEETDLAWRALDAGWSIRYEPGAVLLHPVTSPARHATFYRLNARNRVWLARRRLPWLLVPIYLGTWLVLTVVRTHNREGLMAWFRGFREGWRSDAGERAPMSWHTVWYMTRLGRPPII